MKRWLFRSLGLALLVAGGIWAWTFFFPGPEELIRGQLTRLAQTACIRRNESQLARLANAQSLVTFFTTDAEVVVSVPGRLDRTFNGRDELLEAAGGARASLTSLTVEFVDITVAVDPGGQTAQVTLTARANLPGESVPEVQQLKGEMKKVEGHWLLHRVETVRTLR